MQRDGAPLPLPSAALPFDPTGDGPGEQLDQLGAVRVITPTQNRTNPQSLQFFFRLAWQLVNLLRCGNAERQLARDPSLGAISSYGNGVLYVVSLLPSIDVQNVQGSLAHGCAGGYYFSLSDMP